MDRFSGNLQKNRDRTELGRPDPALYRSGVAHTELVRRQVLQTLVNGHRFGRRIALKPPEFSKHCGKPQTLKIPLQCF